jgi:hypothetical protein
VISMAIVHQYPMALKTVGVVGLYEARPRESKNVVS